MSLPFLKLKDSKGAGGTQIITRAPDTKPDDGELPASDAEGAAQDLITAVHAKDVQGVIDAARNLMGALDSEPTADQSDVSSED